MMLHGYRCDTMNDTELLRGIVFFERRLTPMGLKSNIDYRILMREATNRGLRTENLTEQEILARAETEGPDMNRPT